jgi:hypothetical protein
MKALLRVSAVFEAGVAVGLLAVPSVVAQVLLGATLNAPTGLTVARIAGAALLALGVACWLAASDAQSCAARGVVSAMVMYNLGAVFVLGVAGLRPEAVGIGLWPAVILHAVMTVWCITSLFRKSANPFSGNRF